MWILISWLLTSQKPADLGLHCFQNRIYLGVEKVPGFLERGFICIKVCLCVCGRGGGHFAELISFFLFKMEGVGEEVQMRPLWICH